MGAQAPSAVYSPRTQRSSVPPPSHRGSSERPASGSTASCAVPPESSSSVGSTSTSDTGSATRRGANRPGAWSTSGMRAEPSKKLILYQRPRSPSMSPWSPSSTTTVSSAIRSARSDSSSAPVQSST